jgi:V/A-type H+-transporting ATPase subunit C
LSARIEYVYLNTRVSLQAARLLDASRLRHLLRGGPGDRDDVIRHAGLADLPFDDFRDATDLETAFMHRQLEEMLLLLRPLTGPARDFFAYWGRRAEVGNLKALIRGKLSDQPRGTIVKQLMDIGPHARLPTQALLETDDVAEMLRQLERIPEYAEIARQARRIIAGGAELFSIDSALDRQYYAGVHRRAMAVPAADRFGLMILVGDLLDRINLVWLLRYRLSYRLPPAEAYYHLLPGGNHLGRPQLIALAQLDALDAVLGGLPEPLRSLLAGLRTPTEIMGRLQVYQWQAAERLIKRNRPGLARLFAYLLLRERDLRAIRSVLYGTELKLEPDLVEEALNLAIWPDPVAPESAGALTRLRRRAHV